MQTPPQSPRTEIVAPHQKQSTFSTIIKNAEASVEQLDHTLEQNFGQQSNLNPFEILEKRIGHLEQALINKKNEALLEMEKKITDAVLTEAKIIAKNAVKEEIRELKEQYGNDLKKSLGVGAIVTLAYCIWLYTQ